MTGLAIAAGTAAAVVVFIAARRPALARIAVRGAARRKGETALVILGSLLGTAIITGSLIVGDTLDASLRVSAENNLGPVDLMVVSADPQIGAQAAAALEGFDSDDVEGVLGLRAAAAPIAAGDGEQRLANPAAQLIELDFAAAEAFGGDSAATGISGPAPSGRDVVITENLAADLQVAPGDTITAYAYGAETDLTVAGTLPMYGLAGLDVARNAFSTEFPRNVFVAPGLLDTLAEVAAAPAQAAQPPRDVVLVSLTGGVYDAADRTDAASDEIRAALGGLEGADVAPVKRDVLNVAAEAGDQFRELFVAIGSFAVIAGVLLLVNIFVMLAEERKSELGMLRAVGLKRRDLVRVFVIEGSLYAVAAGVFGAMLGIGVGRVIIIVTSGIFESFGELTLTFSAPLGSVVTGGLIGFLIAMATIVVTSLRTSRLNIIRAIRDLPEPADKARRRWVAVVQMLGVVAFGGLAAASISGGEPVGALALPALAGLCLAGLLSRWLPRRLVITVVSTLVLLWTIFANEFFTFNSGDINVFITQGVVLSAAAVALVGQNQELIGGLVRRIGGGGNLVARLGLAYPLARRFRTSMTLAMYSLVVFTLVFISVLSHILGGLTDQAVADEGGGVYDLIVATSPTNPVDPEELRGFDGVERVGVMAVGQALYRPPGNDDFAPWGIGGVDAEFLAGGAPRLRQWDERFSSEAAAWQGVLDDPSLMVADSFFLQGGGGPPELVASLGDRIEVRDPTTGAVVERTIAAVADAGQTFTAWMSVESAQDAVVQLAPIRSYIAVADGADPSQVALRLQGAYIANGLNADSFRDLAEAQTRANTQFFRLMQGFLGLGLLVGIAGLGVIMVRAVRERRRQIGVLRSLGFQSGKVRSMFLLESGFVALEGVVIGTALSLVTAYQIVVKSDFFGDIRIPFSVPWLQLAVLVGAALAFSLLATVGPARQAARIKPAVALRIAD
jgi:putative ABC transport system permease protein